MDSFAMNIIGVFALFFIGMIFLAVWGTKRNNRKLDETCHRLAELRMTQRRTVEEEAEMIKLESWLRRYENRREQPPKPETTDTN